MSDHEHSLKQTTSQLTNLQKEKATLLSNLKEQKEKYELFEKSVQPKLVEFRNENAQVQNKFGIHILI